MNKRQFNDLTGQRFEKLTVIAYAGNNSRHLWKCKCDCEKEIIITAGNLKKQKSCGCYRTPKAMKNLTGLKFGKLTAIEYLGVLSSGKGKKVSMWRCKCDCGKETIVRATSLKNGLRAGQRGTKSCGCYVSPRTNTAGKANIIGKRFGKLTAIKFLGSRGYKPYWECHCDCGNICSVYTYSLTSGNTKSCGCRKGRFIHGEFAKGKASYAKFRRKNPEIKLRGNISTSIRTALKNNKTPKNKISVLKHLPYTIDDLKNIWSLNLKAG